ncbi:MAG: LytTR family DNA-binding domain-containing protein, partial [Cyclobacteriaceae bacterium]
YKTLKLSGYSLCALASIAVIHFFERWRYKSRDHRWHLPDEAVALLSGLLLLSFLCYLYNHLVVNGHEVRLAYFWEWALMFGLPFAPVYLPLWAYLRYRFGTVEITKVDREAGAETITLEGRNQNEQIYLESDQFVMAHAQANYVDVYLIRGSTLQKHTLRASLSAILEQLPYAQRVHRSYLVNVAYLEALEGNSRKGWARLAHLPEPVPVSPKHFTVLKNYLQNRPKTSK